MKTCKSIACQNEVDATLSHDYCYHCAIRSLNLFQGEGNSIVSKEGAATHTYTLTGGPQKIREADPHGKSQHEPGAKVDAGKVRMHLITGGMARAITEVAKVGTFGAAKYTDGGWVEVPDGFRRYEDAQQRHAAWRHMGESVDKDSNLLHLAHEAWNAMAKLDLYLRKQEQVKTV